MTENPKQTNKNQNWLNFIKKSMVKTCSTKNMWNVIFFKHYLFCNFCSLFVWDFRPTLYFFTHLETFEIKGHRLLFSVPMKGNSPFYASLYCNEYGHQRLGGFTTPVERFNKGIKADYQGFITIGRRQHVMWNTMEDQHKHLNVYS